MRNVFLETMLLKLLHEQQPMSFPLIMNHVDVEVEQPYLTRDELLGTIRRLQDLGLISERRNLLGYERFSLTEKGEQAFDETVFGTQRGKVVERSEEGASQVVEASGSEAGMWHNVKKMVTYNLDRELS